MKILEIEHSKQIIETDKKNTQMRIKSSKTNKNPQQKQILENVVVRKFERNGFTKSGKEINDENFANLENNKQKFSHSNDRFQSNQLISQERHSCKSYKKPIVAMAPMFFGKILKKTSQVL